MRAQAIPLIAVTRDDMPIPSDAELVDEAVAGSQPAFACLMERYRPLMWRVVSRMTLNADDSCDVCQEIMLKLWRTLGRFEPSRPFAPWLRTIVVRETLRWLELHRRGPRLLTIDELAAELEPAAPDASARTRLIAQDTTAHMAVALGELSAQQRTAVTLRFYEDLSLDEMADAMECSTGSVKQHLFRAMQKLRILLKGEWTS